MINKKNLKKSKDQESSKKVIVIKIREHLRKLSTGNMNNFLRKEACKKVSEV